MVIDDPRAVKSIGVVNSVGEVMVLLEKHLADLQRHQVQDHSVETPYRFPFGVWFRGHGDARVHKLTPTAFRSRYDETSLFHHFQMRAPEYRRTHQSTFDWLCLMQHYELPTRLLDWSESVLVALFFAVEKERHRKAEGRVYILNARRLNGLGMLPAEYGREGASVYTPWSLGTVARSQLAVSRSIADWQQRMSSMSDMESWRTAICRQLGSAPELGTEVLTALRDKQAQYIKSLWHEVPADTTPPGPPVTRPLRTPRRTRTKAP